MDCPAAGAEPAAGCAGAAPVPSDGFDGAALEPPAGWAGAGVEAGAQAWMTIARMMSSCRLRVTALSFVDAHSAKQHVFRRAQDVHPPPAISPGSESLLRVRTTRPYLGVILARWLESDSKRSSIRAGRRHAHWSPY